MTHDVRAALIVAAFASVLPSAAGATQSTVNYNVAIGTCSKPIAVPANNKPVLIMGTQIAYGYRGEGYVTIIRYTNNNRQLLEWAGTDYNTSVARGFSNGAGEHIMWLDYTPSYVDLQSAASAHIQVCNNASNPFGTAAGYLTFFY